MTYTALLLVLFSILTSILWLWAVIDVVKAQFKNTSMKFVAIVAIFLMPIFGPILYFQFKRQLTVKPKRRFQPKFT